MSSNSGSNTNSASRAKTCKAYIACKHTYALQLHFALSAAVNRITLTAQREQLLLQFAIIRVRSKRERGWRAQPAAAYCAAGHSPSPLLARARAFID